MSDEPPQLVDPAPGQYPSTSAGWPTHGTPMFGIGHFATPAVQPEWGGFGTPWPASSGAVLTPIFPATQPMPGAGWPGPSPAVTQVPIPTGTVAQGNDEWVHVQPAQGEEWQENKGSLPNRFATMMSSSSRSRSLSKSSASRPLSPFSTDSSSLSSHHSDLVRSQSWTSTVSEHDKRPPREWRSDFSMSRSPRIGAAIGSLLHLSPRSRSTIRRASLSSPKVTLNPYIRYSSSRPPMFLDLREPPPRVYFHELARHACDWDLMRYACEPPLPVMVFYSSYFPWYIEARTQNPVGVTLYEMFLAIWQSMMTPITREDYYNTEMDQEARELIALAWAHRCGDSQEERNKGIRRVDFLVEKVGLEGVAKGKNGYFELKLKKV